jgi:hypothetical protein
MTVWSWNVWSTTKPRSASVMPGLSSRDSGIVPNCSAASAHVASVPGTPTAMPLVTRCG